MLGGNLGVVDGRERKSRRLYRYSPSRDRWTRLPDAPSARAALGLVAIGHRLYAAGGYDETDQRLQRLEIYDTKRRRWTSGAPMSTGRNHVGAAVARRPDGGHRRAAWGRQRRPDRRSRPTTRTPTAGRPCPRSGTARSGHTAVVTRGRLVVFGGEELTPGGRTIEQVETYDPARDAWSSLPPMVTPRHGLGGVARGGRVYALEGGPQPGLAYSRALEYLDLP